MGSPIPRVQIVEPLRGLAALALSAHEVVDASGYGAR